MQIDSQVKCIDNEERHSWRTLSDGLTLSGREGGHRNQMLWYQTRVDTRDRRM